MYVCSSIDGECNHADIVKILEKPMPALVVTFGGAVGWEVTRSLGAQSGPAAAALFDSLLL